MDREKGVFILRRAGSGISEWAQARVVGRFEIESTPLLSKLPPVKVLTFEDGQEVTFVDARWIENPSPKRPDFVTMNAMSGSDSVQVAAYFSGTTLESFPANKIAHVDLDVDEGEIPLYVARVGVVSFLLTLARGGEGETTPQPLNQLPTSVGQPGNRELVRA